MKKTSCLGEFMRYTSLNVLGMIGLSCYILADTFFIARGLGSDGLAALNIAIPRVQLCTWLRYDAGNGRSHKILYFPGAENGTGGQQDLYEYRVSGWDLCLDLCPYGTWIFRKYHVSSWR